MNKIITNSIQLVICSFVSVVLVGGPLSYAATTAAVSASVTVQNISVAVSDGTISYGTLATNTNSDTTSAGLNDSQTATNDGNISADLNVRGQNSSAWTLAGTAGVDQYVHSFCISDCDGTPTWNSLTTNYQTLSSGVASSGSQVFDLRVTTPTSSTSYTSQSIDVTVQASAP